MPGSLLDCVERYAIFQQKANGCMPQVMKTHFRQSSFLKQSFELRGDTFMVEWCPDGCGENQVVFLPTISGKSLDQFLPFSVSHKLLKHHLPKLDLALACFRVLGERVRTLFPQPVAADVEHAACSFPNPHQST